MSHSAPVLSRRSWLAARIWLRQSGPGTGGPGAKAVLIGRPYCYGLAAFGGPGVERVLAILRSELVNNMGLAGVGSLKEIDSSLVRYRR